MLSMNAVKSGDRTDTDELNAADWEPIGATPAKAGAQDLFGIFGAGI
jgi:hypothetical protein